MNFSEYAQEAQGTAIYPKEQALQYLTLGLVGEAGEVAEKMKKHLRGDKPLDTTEMRKELGDVLWYLTMLAHEFGSDLEGVAVTNIIKLRSRQERDVLKGDGDNR